MDRSNGFCRESYKSLDSSVEGVWQAAGQKWLVFFSYLIPRAMLEVAWIVALAQLVLGIAED